MYQPACGPPGLGPMTCGGADSGSPPTMGAKRGVASSSSPCICWALFLNSGHGLRLLHVRGLLGLVREVLARSEVRDGSFGRVCPMYWRSVRKLSDPAGVHAPTAS